MGDPGLEKGLLRVGFIDVGRVEIPGHSRVQVNVGLGYRLCKLRGITCLNFIDRLSYRRVLLLMPTASASMPSRSSK